MSCSQLIIAGMHHTGTSILSNLTMTMGIYGGSYDDFLFSKKNPMKFWERRDIVSVNQARLDEFEKDSSIPNWSGYTYKKTLENRIHERSDAKNIIQKLNTRCNWVTKDPRFGLLLHEWLPLLSNPLCMVVTRNKTDTINSLNLYSHEPQKWSEVYDRYYSEIYSTCLQNNIPTLNISNEELVYDPMKVVEDIKLFLRKNKVSYSDTERIYYKRKDEAYVTMITDSNEDYILGARVLTESIKKIDDTRDIVCMTTEDVDQNVYDRYMGLDSFVIQKKVETLEEFWWNKCPYKSSYKKSIRWGKMMTKLRLWQLGYKKILYLDPDSMLLKSMDSLPKIFSGIMAQEGKVNNLLNAGTMVLTPNETVFQKFMEYENKNIPDLYGNVIDCTEQALLNTVFKNYTKLNVARPETTYKIKGDEVAIHWITNWCPKPWNNIFYKDCHDYYYKLWNGIYENIFEREYKYTVSEETIEQKIVGRRLNQVLRSLKNRFIRDAEYESMYSMYNMENIKIIIFVFVLLIFSGIGMHNVLTKFLTIRSLKTKGFEMLDENKLPTVTCADDSSDEEDIKK